jgi:DNA-binding transcriptional MocR family regulator
MSILTSEDLPLYERIANLIEKQVADGTLRSGDKVLSIREMSRQQRVSISTIIQAYWLLESKGILAASPQSGFYVRTPYRELPPEPECKQQITNSTTVEVSDLVSGITSATLDPSIVSFGAADLCPSLFPNSRLNKIISCILRDNPTHSSSYDFPPGLENLRKAIAKRSSAFGCDLGPNDIVTTNGCTEAMNLALRTVASKGDVIAIESPTYYGILQVIEGLGMKALEIPTDFKNGMELGSLSVALKKHRVKACLLSSNFQNPLGFLMPEDKKKEIVKFITKHNLPLIEDDVYGDLGFSNNRPPAIKSYDKKNLVLLCASFSKTLSPGFRVGWIAPGSRFIRQIQRLKFTNSVATPSLQQMAIAEFLETGNYDRHLRVLRRSLYNQIQLVTKTILNHFPEGTRVSRPVGGFVLWVEFHNKFDSIKLYRRALEEKIAVSPGIIFSASKQFKNCVRINCGMQWDERVERALIKLGYLALEQKQAKN